MIGYFLKVGDEETSHKFTPYIRKETGVKSFIDKLSGHTNDKLGLILIMYYVEGRFPINGPSGYKVNNYSTKDKSISVAHTVLPEFWQVSERNRKQYILDSTIEAIKLVKDRLEKKRLGIDFDSIEKDFMDYAEQWLLDT